MASIKKVTRKSGEVKWSVIYDDPSVYDRRVQRRKTFDTEREAKLFAARFTIDKDRGGYVEPSKEKLGVFLHRWLQSAQVKPSTKHRYRLAFDTHIIPAIGRVPVGRVTAVMVQDLIDTMLKKGYTPNTVRSVHTALSSAMKQAVKWNQIQASPCIGLVLPPKEKKVKRNVWTAEQVKVFFDVTYHHHHSLAWRLAFFTGMRLGEVVATRWDDIDLEKKTIMVSLTETFDEDGKKTYGPPKSETSNRVIPLPDSLIEDLKRHKRNQNQRRLQAESWNPQNFVFDVPGKNGDAYKAESVSDAFNRAASRYGFPTINFHGIRHTHATMLMAARVPAKIIQDRLGHASVSTTLDLYSHVSEDMQQEVTNMVEQMLVSDIRQAQG